jgi:hypothetical protein
MLLDLFRSRGSLERHDFVRWPRRVRVVNCPSSSMAGDGHERHLVSLGAKGSYQFLRSRPDCHRALFTTAINELVGQIHVQADGGRSGQWRSGECKDLLFEGTLQSDILRHQRNFLNPMRSAATDLATAAQIALVQPPEGLRRVQSAYAPASLKTGRKGTDWPRLVFAVRRKSEREVMASAKWAIWVSTTLNNGQFSYSAERTVF